MPVPVSRPSATRPRAQPKFHEAMYWVPAMDSMGISEAVAIHTAHPVTKPSTGPCEMEPNRAIAPGSG